VERARGIRLRWRANWTAGLTGGFMERVAAPLERALGPLGPMGPGPTVPCSSARHAPAYATRPWALYSAVAVAVAHSFHHCASRIPPVPQRAWPAHSSPQHASLKPGEQARPDQRAAAFRRVASPSHALARPRPPPSSLPTAACHVRAAAQLANEAANHPPPKQGPRLRQLQPPPLTLGGPL
jgi:hypothetical protein